MKKLLFLLLALSIASCAPDKLSADLLIKNATIYTVDNDFSTANALVVKDGKILEIGLKPELELKYNIKETYDAKGNTIVPGLIDAHAHLYGLGLALQQVDLVGTTSFEEVLGRVVAFQEEKNMPYIIGRGWDQNDWDDKNFPTKKELDSLFPNTPVSLRRIDGHAMLVNSKALELAGITSKTKVAGGEIVLGNNEPTGIIIDAPMGLIGKTFPEITAEVSAEALLEAEKICLQYGLTTVDDAGLGRNIIELIDSLQKDGKFKLRMYAMVSNSPENRDYYLNNGTYKTDRLNVRSFKVYADGALGSRGATMREAYSDMPGHFGAMITTADSLDYLAQKFAASEFQMNTHAIGDSANIAVLRAYKKALDGKTDRRWRVEHAQIISPQDFNYFDDNNNILPSVQPTHATSDMYWAEDRVGAERMKGAYAFKTMLDKAGIVALGTDFPVEQVNPMYTFYAAVARKDLKNYPENGFQMKDALTREEALKGMTIWAAFANFEEKEKGSIEVGKFADFTVLDKDIMKVDENELPNIKVIATFINGEMVYQAK
ncbi:amidohydrolase [Aequorivita antarctica]|uniref:Amidohydrolase n=1 Tax=Aequorivita antarctica TaxID=153266 RepID=A0A5C6YZP2_9FLAO|nr:amidohydrolase [Aequorivita antarctica]TXD72675.1 amidohydrolase [Aequorivita antarctica]SRX74806.1 N-substituted formamide deformylase [Aequorivita antarctica]